MFVRGCTIASSLQSKAHAPRPQYLDFWHFEKTVPAEQADAEELAAMLGAWGAAEQDPSIVEHRRRLAEPRLRERTGFDAEGEALQVQRVAADIKRVLDSELIDEPTKQKLVRRPCCTWLL